MDLSKPGEARRYVGYMVEAEWDGRTLRARGTNKAGQMALRGQQRNEGDVVLTREEIAEVSFKRANPLVNGSLVIVAKDGARYQLHFRRKSSEEFTELAKALGAKVQ